jgi:hypothetical protein
VKVAVNPPPTLPLTVAISCDTLVNVRGTPLFPSRISLRIRCVNEGYGPAVSVGATAHAELVPVVVVGVVVVLEGLVGVSPPQANVGAAPRSRQEFLLPLAE